MKNVTITLTMEQAKLLRYIISRDTNYLRTNGYEREWLDKNDRIDTELVKAMINANDGKPVI